MKSINRTACLMLLLVCIAGCGESVNLVPVQGTVTIDGEPAGGIMVQFVPSVVDETVVAPTSQALTDDSGKFDLYTLQNEHGAVEGGHFVSLFDTLEERPEQGQEATRPPRLDPKFASGHIKVEVKQGEEVKLEATSPK